MRAPHDPCGIAFTGVYSRFLKNVVGFWQVLYYRYKDYQKSISNSLGFCYRPQNGPKFHLVFHVDFHLILRYGEILKGNIRVFFLRP